MKRSRVKLLPLAIVFFSFAAHAERSITVSGRCLRSAIPDRAAVTATSDFVDLELEKASKKAMSGYEQFKAAVTKLNLKGLELATSESSIQEEREWQKDKSVFKGFRARMGLTVSSSEVARLGEVISLAAKTGLRQVSGLSMFLSPEKEKIEREACLEEAVKNSRAKAESIAKAASAKLGKILMVNEGGAIAPPPQGPMLMARAAKGSATAEDATIDAAPERISVEVTATYAID